MSQDKQSAQIGSLPGRIVAANIAEWVFSNPFSTGAHVGSDTSTRALTAHTIPEISPLKPLFVDTVSGAQISRLRLRQDALRIAAGLHAMGFRPEAMSSTLDDSLAKSFIPAPVMSSVILIYLPNCLPFVSITLGVFASGLTASMANPALTSGELAWILQNAKPQAIVTSTTGWPVMKAAIEELSDSALRSTLLEHGRVFVVDPTHDDFGLVPIPSSPSPPGTRDWKVLLTSPPLDEPVAMTSSEAAARTAVILWSSGTTGRSKGVLLSHRALIMSAIAVWHCNSSYDDSERWLGFVPFYHVFGLICVLLSGVACGATVCVMPRFEPRRMLELVQQYRITSLHIAPPIAVLLAKSPLVDTFDLSSLKGAVSGGAPLPTEIVRSVYGRLNFVVKLGYGITEAGSVSHQVGDTWEELEPQLGHAGAPLYGVELKIVPVEGDRKTVLKRNEDGEILVRSYSVMNCYLHNPDATAEALDEDGWFHTGDVGHLDRSGNLWITDRLKEMIKVKGFQVSPADLENVLCGMDAVADAGVSAIYSNEQATELPRAYIVPADAQLQKASVPGGTLTNELQRLADDVKRHVETKVAHYKFLRGNIVFVHQIPKSPSGKILRRLLKDQRGVDACIYPPRQPSEGVAKAKL